MTGDDEGEVDRGEADDGEGPTGPRRRSRVPSTTGPFHRAGVRRSRSTWVANGYVREEFFVAGTASAYSASRAARSRWPNGQCHHTTPPTTEPRSWCVGRRTRRDSTGTVPRRMVQRVGWSRSQPETGHIWALRSSAAGMAMSGCRPQEFGVGAVAPLLGVPGLEQRSGLVGIGPRALWIAPAPRRQVRLRHAVADRPGPSAPGSPPRSGLCARNGSSPWRVTVPRSS